MALVFLGAALALLRVSNASPAASAPGSGPEFAARIRPFLEQHCFDCHDSTTQKGGVRLDQLPPNPTEARDVERWIDVMDQLGSGAMPPRKKPRPDARQQIAVVEWIAAQVRVAEARRHGDGSGLALRRLNRVQYENTIRDLLGVTINAAALFPEDPTLHGFDNQAAALSLSPTHVERYLAVAGSVLRQAIVTGLEPKRAVFRREAEVYLPPGQKENSPVRGYSMNRGGRESVEQRPTDVVIKDRGLAFHETKVPVPGEYILRISASGKTVEGCTPRLGVTYAKQGEISRTYFAFDVAAPDGQPQVYEFRVRLAQENARLKTSMIGLINEHWLGSTNLPRGAKRVIPPVAIDYVEIEGPVFDSWPPPSTQRIFFKGVPATPAEETSAYAREILARFLPRAYRRPVAADEIAPLLEDAERTWKETGDFVAGIRGALATVLCSPEFLFVVERGQRAPAGQRVRLTDFELVARLSYFLWSSMPDDRLLALASAGQLRQPATLGAEVRRLLADPKASEFAENFAGQWLQLGRIGQFQPDAKLFPEYDLALQECLAAEPKAFFAELLRRDGSVLQFIDANWSMLNERLARFYGVPGVQGDKFRPVALPPELHRGGVLTQAGVLMLTGDGTRSRPVHRGVWLLESLLNNPPPPPPPNAGELEPNIPGKAKLSVRARLEMHRQQESCAGCHAKIDPLGFAFENFDAIGRWRTVEDDGLPAKKGAPDTRPKINASGQLPDGRTFDGPEGLKKLLLADRELFVKALTEKLLTYALGRGLEFSERAAVGQLVAATRQKNYPLATLVTALVQTEPFLTR